MANLQSENKENSDINDNGETNTIEKKKVNSPLLDGKFFRIISIDANGLIQAECQYCKPLKTNTIRGSIDSTTNFLVHLKVSILKSKHISFYLLCYLYICTMYISVKNSEV